AGGVHVAFAKHLQSTQYSRYSAKRINTVSIGTSTRIYIVLRLCCFKTSNPSVSESFSMHGVFSRRRFLVSSVHVFTARTSRINAEQAGASATRLIVATCLCALHDLRGPFFAFTVTIASLSKNHAQGKGGAVREGGVERAADDKSTANAVLVGCGASDVSCSPSPWSSLCGLSISRLVFYPFPTFVFLFFRTLTLTLTRPPARPQPFPPSHWRYHPLSPLPSSPPPSVPREHSYRERHHRPRCHASLVSRPSSSAVSSTQRPLLLDPPLVGPQPKPSDLIDNDIDIDLACTTIPVSFVRHA
ncbi:hypothetical protein C8R45DRAFT_1156835, partial [Mycena sanguinolenta]